MKKIDIVKLLVLAVASGSQSLQAQDVHFSQYGETPTSVNPGLSGVTYNTRVIANYRDQWSSIGNKYQTYGLTFEQTLRFRKLKTNYFAIAFNAYKDVAGDAKFTTWAPNIGINYLQKINKQMKLSGGVQGGFRYNTIDISNLRFDRQYDGYTYNPALSNGEDNTPRSSITAFDMGAGVNLNYVQSDKFLSAKNAFRFDAGFSAYHYSLSRTSFIVTSERLETRYCGYFSGEFAVPGSINSIMPSFLVMRQGPSTEIIAGALFKFIIGDPSTYTALKKQRSVAIGGQYRYKDAIVPCLLMQYNTMAIGISYDINISTLTPASSRRGGPEISMRYNILPGYGVNLGRADTRASY